MTKHPSQMSDAELLIDLVTRAENAADLCEVEGQYAQAEQLRHAARVGEDTLIEIGAVQIKLPVGQE